MLAPVVLAAACSTSTGGPQHGDTLVIGGQNVEVQGTDDVGGQTAEDVDQIHDTFDPTVLSGSGGQTLTITLHNRDSVTHNFSLPQQQVDQDVAPGGAATVTVTFPANGELPFFCKYHRSAGMLGLLRAG